MIDLNIINGKVFFAGKLQDINIGIKNGYIVALGKSSSLPKAEQTIDATGLTILPGGIDVHTHILDLLFDYREDFYTGTQAAAAGGITTVLEMPLGIEEKTVLEAFDLQLQGFNDKSLVDYGIIGAAGYSSIDTIAKLAEKGVIGFKTFVLDAPEELSELKDLAAKDDSYLLKIFTEIAKTGLVSCIHAENDAIISKTVEKMKDRGKIDFAAHTASRPSIAEEEAAMRAILLAHETNVKLNLVHMSSNNAFDYIRWAKNQGWDVTCEITPHHLFLTAEEGVEIGPWAKSDPPLRSINHQTSAWKALNDGTIDMVASDHSPYSHKEKSLEQNQYDIFNIGSGTPGLDTMIPLLLDAVNKNKLSLKRMVQVTATNPAKRFDIYPEKGVIAIGSEADLVLVDMKERYVIRNENMHTKQKITIFDGWEIQGKIKKTLIRGKIVWDEGKFAVKKGYGKFIKGSNTKPSK